MNIYEVINPSDPVRFWHDRDDVAAMATVLVGEGRYGCKRDGEMVCPLMLFGGVKADLVALFGTTDLTAWVNRDDNRAEVVECLRRWTVGRFDELTAAQAMTPEDRAAWNEKRRGSLNDICGRARELADWLERSAQEAK